VLVSVAVSAAVSAGVAWVVAGLTTPTASTVADEGTATFLIRRGNERAELQVFYKVPFASPPKLTFPEGVGEDAEVVEQRADSFKLRSSWAHIASEKTVSVVWRAEGVLVPQR